MRHLSGNKTLSRHPEHRLAMMRNMVINVVEHGRIRTTIQKAKAAKPVIEKIITLGKKGTPHHRRLAITELGSTVAAKRAVKKVFSELKDQFADRNGGYTRILRLPKTIRLAQCDLPRGAVGRSKLYGTRLGDNSVMVFLELTPKDAAKREKKAPKAIKPRKAKTEAAAQ